MTNPAQAAIAAVTARPGWTGATVAQRLPSGIVLAHPTEPERYTLAAVRGPMHYNGDQEIDTAWQTGDGQPYFRQMVQAEYNAYAGLNTGVTFGAGQIIEYRHPATGGFVKFQPQDLNWLNEWDSTQFISAPQNVAAVIDDDVLYWSGAYGAGRDFRWWAQPGRLRKDLILNSLAQLGAPPGWMTQDLVRLQLRFLFEVGGGVTIWYDGVGGYQQWNQSTRVQTNAPVEFRIGGEAVWWFLPGRATDADGAKIDVATRLSGSGGVLFVEVLVPWLWLRDTAVFPVNVDPTVTPSVSASADDVAFNSTLWLDGETVAWVGFAGTGGTEVHGTAARFSTGSGTIPAGATINSAYTEWTAHASRTDNLGLETGFLDAADPAMPASKAAFNAAAKTSSVQGAWTADTSAGSLYGSGVDMTAAFQELVDDYGGSIDHVVVYWRGWEDGSGYANLRQVFRQYDYASGDAMSLYVDYTAVAGGGDVLNRGLSGIECGVVASGGGGHSGLHPIEAGYVS